MSPINMFSLLKWSKISEIAPIDMHITDFSYTHFYFNIIFNELFSLVSQTRNPRSFLNRDLIM